MVRRTALLLLVLLLLLPAEARAKEKEETVTAKAYALLEAGSGRLLLGDHAHDRLPMASTTKIMTALLALESGEDLTTLVTVPAEVAGTEGSSMHLIAGEQISLWDLLFGLMMVSGNDAAVALAIHLSGSVEAFAARMNARAAALGCTDTHFANPHGLHDPSHYTSAFDLASIARAAMALPVFQELVSTEKYVAATGSRPRTFRTKNKVLTQIEGGCGVKTGYTKKAGRCLCFAARREGMLLVGAVLNAPDMWNDAGKILDRGFSTYELHTFMSAGQEAGRIPVTGSEKKTLPAAVKEGILYPIRRDGQEDIRLDIRLAGSLTAPVEPGESVGEAVLTVNGERVAAVPLIVEEGAAVLSFGWFFRRVMEAYEAS